jgi:hypothetical protein
MSYTKLELTERYSFKASSELETDETCSKGNVITGHIPVHQTIHNSKFYSFRKILCDITLSESAVLDNDTSITREL